MTQDHWDSVYGVGAPEGLAWYQPVPATLSDVVAHSTPDDPVIDVGGGTSTLALELVRRGYVDVTVLDISERAISASRAALWQHTDAVSWVHQDVVDFRPERQWRLWHDRAVFHFLVEESDRSGYRSAAADAVGPGGTLIVATFAPDGPERCAGLPVRRYDVSTLAAEFAPHFEYVDGHRLAAASTAGDQRPYVAAILRKVS